MRILWHNNAPWAATGYGNQTKLFAPRLIKAGHECAITAFYGLEGGILTWNGVPVFPRAFHPYGNDVLAAHAQNYKADILITLVDAWVIEPNLIMAGVKWVPWFRVGRKVMDLRWWPDCQTAEGLLLRQFLFCRGRRGGGRQELIMILGHHTKTFVQH